MIRRKSRAYGRRKMFGGVWVKKQDDGFPIDEKDADAIDKIILKYKAGDASVLGNGIDHACRIKYGSAKDPDNTVVLELPSRRVIKFDWTPEPSTHSNNLSNIKYISKTKMHDLKEILPPSQHPKSNEYGEPVDGSGRRM
jgi:hypothetical protein